MYEAVPSPGSQLVLCHQCDWIMQMPRRAPGQSAYCPRCQHRVAAAAQRDMQRPLACALAALIMLSLVFAFDFLSFSTRGVGHTMMFADSAGALLGYHYPLLAALVLATTTVIPGLYLGALVYLCAGIRRGHRLPGGVVIARTLRPLEPWMMADVFIVGVLVSLIKIVTLAQVHVGPGFLAFCAYALLLLRTLTLIDWLSLWNAIAPPPSTECARSGGTGYSQHLVGCLACDTPFADRTPHRCPRCGKQHVSYRLDRLQLTWALLVTATILYIPANIYPIMSTRTLGTPEPQTIVGGVIHLAETGSWPIAAVIFVASIVVPISKILALARLCLDARRTSENLDRPQGRRQMRLYRITETIGRWSMIDVFVVAVLGALVQAGALMSIHPGPAALSFAAVVVVTMIAALTFDTRRLWR